MFRWLLNVVSSGVVDNSSSFSSSQPSNTTTTTVNADFNPTALFVAILTVVVFVLIIVIYNMSAKIKELDKKISEHFPEEIENEDFKEE